MVKGMDSLLQFIFIIAAVAVLTENRINLAAIP